MCIGMHTCIESGNTGYVQCKKIYVFLSQIYEFQNVLNVLLNTRSFNQLQLLRF